VGRVSTDFVGQRRIVLRPANRCDNPLGGDPICSERQRRWPVLGGAIRAAPILEEMAAFYEPDFLPDVQGEASLRARLFEWERDRVAYRSEVRWLLRFLESGSRYLDYSAGTGRIVRLVQRYRPFTDVYATEFSPAYREMLSRHLPEAHIRSELSGFHGGIEFDCISAFGVLEHVPSPTGMIRGLGSRLRRGGTLILTVPNPDSWQRTWSGPQWWCWLAPRHMYLMNMPTLVQLLEENHFRIVRQWHYLSRYCTTTLVGSLAPSLHPANASGWRMLAFGVLYFAARPVEWLASRHGRGGFMGVVAAKGA